MRLVAPRGKADGRSCALQAITAGPIARHRTCPTFITTSQRKRLALLTAYLEDRPCYVFDEWASDQDPLFKEVFYHRILPTLRDNGKTVLVITHDDKYFQCADRLIKLDYGQLDHSQLEEEQVALLTAASIQ